MISSDVQRHGFVLGEHVMIHDRYRFAIAVKGKILAFSELDGDGVELELITTNNMLYDVGDTVWVDHQQLRLTSEETDGK